GSADLVLVGQQPADSDGAVLWAAVAERLRLPMVSQAAELEVAAGKATVKRQTEFGYDRIEAPLPAVIAVSDAINEPRYPSLKGVMGAKSKPQDVVSLADLGGAPEPAGASRSQHDEVAPRAPPRRGGGAAVGQSRSSASSWNGRSCEHPRLPRAARGRAPEGSARRAREGGFARQRQGRRCDCRDGGSWARRRGRPPRRREGLGRRGRSAR